LATIKLSYRYGHVNKEEEEHRDLGGAIDPKKLVACLASLYRFAYLRGARKRVNYGIC
jgi:hypothetical protein